MATERAARGGRYGRARIRCVGAVAGRWPQPASGAERPAWSRRSGGRDRGGVAGRCARGAPRTQRAGLSHTVRAHLRWNHLRRKRLRRYLLVRSGSALHPGHRTLRQGVRPIRPLGIMQFGVCLRSVSLRLRVQPVNGQLQHISQLPDRHVLSRERHVPGSLHQRLGSEARPRSGGWCAGP
jgi:hypothetical protein